MCKITRITFVFHILASTAFLPHGLCVDAGENDRTDYGQRIEGVAGDTEVWWCETGWKVARERVAPKETLPHAALSAARNDWEAVQIVVRPNKELKGLKAAVGTLNGPDGATILTGNIQVLRVYYHYVHAPQASCEGPPDTSVAPDWWPDALPLLDKPFDLPAHKNQPLWVLIHVPKDAKAGDYSGKLTLNAKGWSAEVPLRLHVWDFTLPEQNHLETAFGLSAHNIFRYHQLKNDADKRRVFDMYLQNFADHRISPDTPAPLDPIGVKFVPEADPLRTEVDFSAFDAEMDRVLEKYHFTNFRLPLQGMSYGNCSGRGPEPEIKGFRENTPQYQAMFSSYVKQLEAHLREKGWLGMAYTYWYDEPQPDVFDFVRTGMERLKKHAPGLQNMLTKEPHDELIGPIDIWCLLTPQYKDEIARQRCDHGERFWWYVCCAPKAPFCTLFIDQPATDLRVWLWQTWQRDIAGILIWETTYWTSRSNLDQNPYEDPMAYVVDSRPEEKKYYGNGDGRFLYPPMSAAKPDISGDAPIIEPPVSSIRWEMLREGIEDYEYLWLLRDLIHKKRNLFTGNEVASYEALLTVPDEITHNMTTYTSDPRPIYARRAAIAEAIERLIKMQPDAIRRRLDVTTSGTAP